MSFNIGGNPPPVPGNLPDQNAPPAPPAQPVAPAVNAPVMNAAAPPAQPLEVPESTNADLPSSEPTFAEKEAGANQPATQVERYKWGWKKVEAALQRGDTAFVHRMLDQGLLPFLVEEDQSGIHISCLVPWGQMLDIELIDRLIDLSVRQGMQSDIYSDAFDTGNGVLLLRLVQSAVGGWQEVPQHLEKMIAQAVKGNDVTQLAALLRIWKEHCPTCQIDWQDIWESMHHLPSIDLLKVLVRELQPDRFSEYTLAQMFQLAMIDRKVEAVACLCGWLADDIAAFAQSEVWKVVQDLRTVDELITLARGGLPVAREVFPPPGKPMAGEFQLALFGPKLAKGDFAKMLVAESCSSAEVISFVLRAALPGSVLLLWTFHSCSLLSAEGIASALFRKGLTPALSIKLALAMAEYLQAGTSRFGRIYSRLDFLACLNEAIHPDAVDPLTDPLSIEQAHVIHDAALEEVKRILGQPEAFFAFALACIRPDGTVNFGKLGLIYGTSNGLPNALVAQIGKTLNTLCAEVMAGALPPTLFRPGMTGAEFQQAFHDWIRQGVARLIITRLPRELGATIAKRDWGQADEDSDDADNAVAAFELAAPVNYLVTSVIRQYGDILAENPEESVAAILDVFRALPADAFNHLPKVIANDDSSSAEPSVSDSEAESEVESESDSV
jgi:hypothetical protein